MRGFDRLNPIRQLTSAVAFPRLGKTLLLSACLLCALRPPVAAAVTIFVRSNASGANNGTSWANAYTSLQTALAAAVATDEIWVAAGTYKPTATADRTISFALKNGVGVYGGFAGTETMRSQANPGANITILSGDIGNTGVDSDNSYHVVTSDSTVTATGILDGFTITAGRADGASDPIDRGGGAYINLGGPTFVRCLFSGNYAGNRGGGVRVAAGSPSFTGCKFLGNHSESAGAGLSAASVGSLLVRRTYFNNNVVGNTTGGGAIEATNNTTVLNCVVYDNGPNGMNFLGDGNTIVNSTIVVNVYYGVAFFATGNSIVNSIIWSHTAGSIFLGPSAGLSVSYSDIEGGGFAGAGNIQATPLFNGTPDVRLAPGFAGIDAGNNAAVPAGTTTDFGGLPRFFDDPEAPNVGAGSPPIVDMGATERVPFSVSVLSDQTVCAGSTATFSVTVSGSAPFAYRWRKDAVDLSDVGHVSGSATATLTVQPAAVADSGYYDVIVTDNFGQTITTGLAVLFVYAPPSPVASNNGPICVGQTLQLSASSISGATYSWSGPNSFTSSQQNPSIPSTTLAASGTYSVTATVAGCVSPVAMTSAVVNTSPSSTITAPASVCPNSGGHGASVPDAGVGATYAWSIGNGAITAGAGTRSITFTAGASGMVTLGVTVAQSGGCSSMGSTNVTILPACAAAFYTLPPCRVLDTRDSAGPWGGPALNALAERTFVFSNRCGIPSSARSVSLNLTVTASTAGGHLSLYPGGTALPLVSAMNYSTGQTRANNAIVPLGGSGTLTVFCGQSSGTAHVIIDVNGYFE